MWKKRLAALRSAQREQLPEVTSCKCARGCDSDGSTSSTICARVKVRVVDTSLATNRWLLARQGALRNGSCRGRTMACHGRAAWYCSHRAWGAAVSLGGSVVWKSECMHACIQKVARLHELVRHEVHRCPLSHAERMPARVHHSLVCLIYNGHIKSSGRSRTPVEGTTSTSQ